MKIATAVASISCCAVFCALAAPAVRADTCIADGARFDDTVRVDGQELVRNGCGANTIHLTLDEWLHTFDGALYVARRTTRLSEILSSRTPLQVRLHFANHSYVRNVAEGLRSATHDDALADRLTSAAWLTLTRHDRRGLEVHVDDAMVGRIRSPRAARAFLTWLFSRTVGTFGASALRGDASCG